MDYHNILSALISNEDDHAKNFHDKLAQILQKTMPILSEDMKQSVKDLSIRDQYLQAISHILRGIKQENATVDTDAPFSVKQYQSIKIAIELIVSIGVIPCLLPGVGVGMARLCPRASKISEEEHPGYREKYERLCSSTLLLLDCFADLTLRPAVLSQIGSLMAALLQLSHAPLAKPLSDTQRCSDVTVQNKQEFRMTMEEYDRLQNRQKEFHNKLTLLLDECPQYVCFRELMVILGMQSTPRWLRREAQNYLIKILTQSNGVLSLIAAVCQDGLDLGADWEKLDTVSKLIAVSHGKNADEYYKAVCRQILDLLSSNKIKHSSTIANCCIKALYDYNPDTCQKYIVEVICAPLIMKETHATKSEKVIEQCINNLINCFLTEDAKFKHLPCKVISCVAVPLFCLYDKTRESACILKRNLQRLLLKILEEESMREKLYSAFLGHDASTGLGDYVTSQFGPTGGVEITGPNRSLEYEELSGTVFDLVSTTKGLSPSLFCYMLKYLSNANKLSYEVEQRQVLETEDDKMRRVAMQLTAYKLVSQLASTSTVQDAQIKNPEPLLSFIKSLFDEYTKNHQGTQESECEILYISLMLIKIILTERKATVRIDLFKDFSAFLEDRRRNSNMPIQLKSLIDEVVACIITHDPSEKHRVRSEKIYYQDMSIDPTASSKFDEAIKDLADPLLPVRAHGIITLAKLIENKDPCTVARKAIVLRLFQENLKHEDSFIYLTSINGLCALATAYPKEIIETLMPEYVDMPNRITGAEITVETRIKLGEILVKTTRALGEMSVVHKNALINGFLCSARDADPLIRASSLSCLGELCKVLGFRLGNILVEVRVQESCGQLRPCKEFFLDLNVFRSSTASRA
ncbi:Transmembrane and coiled-coil domain-containing protein [Ooceraea biroi]|uniref:Transmembrane and coiled-coil domain-containing protein n=1 Tax=Ooceraea biroi TaxID=2015173 RepID=A0A026WC48_OOCBI|nr:Transmembrane and coiled-coil domain-containing protein [Ooceraea biroi]